MLEAASSQFHNAVVQLIALNPGMELNTAGLDEEKEVRNGQVVTPPPEENEEDEN
ncbi:hypothetical protein A2U01_0027518 [Trifolium medium]|uniref:Uncharacterized protein n=1 Tax=Trifolium medium TaxID=97028 RepID=A0A392P385_9FABA|nr:hypothetical protein [Trifolium medium]